MYVAAPIVKKETIISDVDILNPNHFSFKTKNGACNFSFGMLHGCCGVVVIYSVYWGVMLDTHIFYDEFNAHLRMHKEDGLERGAIMMSDAVGGENKDEEDNQPCIYDMCTYLGWEKSSEYYNPRSGNDIVTFMSPREVRGEYNEFPEEARDDYNGE